VRGATCSFGLSGCWLGVRRYVKVQPSRRRWNWVAEARRYEVEIVTEDLIVPQSV
jgi:hypothetical protein